MRHLLPPTTRSHRSRHHHNHHHHHSARSTAVLSRGGVASMRHTLCILALLTAAAQLPLQSSAAFLPVVSGQQEKQQQSQSSPPTTTTSSAASTDDIQQPNTVMVDPEAALRWGHHILRKFGREHRTTALEELDDLASDSGFSTGDTLFLLGRAHDEGREDIGIRRDQAAARELYAKGAELGHPASQHALAAVLASSADEGGEVEAVLYDFFASLGGEPLAHAALGYRYLHGIGTIQNCAQSLKHYEVAARETILDLYADGRGGIGRPVDRTRLADRFVAGRRPAADVEAEAADFWLSSAETGDVISMRTMGVLYHHGTRGVGQDLKESYRWFKEASEEDTVSAAMTADMLMRGAGVPVDHGAAYVLFRRSIVETVSMNGMGYMYYHGLGGLNRDVKKAFEFLEKANSKDKDKNANIVFNLGLLFKGDHLVDSGGNPLEFEVETSTGEKLILKKDLTKALGFFKAAAAYGHVEAAFQAAQVYAQSEPLTIGKCQSAVSYLKKVVEKGPWMRDMREALDLSVTGDNVGSLVLYSRLAEIGVEVAQSNAAWLLDSGHCAQGMENVDTKMIGGLSAGGDGDGGITGSARNETLGVVCQKRALRMYEHAARQGRAAAEVKVGDFHYFGKAGLPVDHEKAAKRYLKASDAKHAEGLFSMGFMHQTGRGVPQDLFLAKRYFDDAAMASADAIPVARLSLLSLRVQATVMRWRAWWRAVVGAPDDAESSSSSSSEGETSDAAHVAVENAMTSEETLALAGLVVLLAAVLGERARRGWERRRLAGEETA